MPRSLFASLLLVLTFGAAMGQVSGPKLFSRLTVNQTNIAFSYAGDIWTVERAGGEARRLTNHPGEENFPVFSSDGKRWPFRDRSVATGMFMSCRPRAAKRDG